MSYDFQYCQKIVVFRHNFQEVLLAKRKGENDFDAMYSFIGGKMESTDTSIVSGLTREKNEEVGGNFKIKIYLDYSVNYFYVKNDGHPMILPHYLAEYESGEIVLSDEYSDYRWVKTNELASFEPKIYTVEEMVNKLLKLRLNVSELNYQII